VVPKCATSRIGCAPVIDFFSKHQAFPQCVLIYGLIAPAIAPPGELAPMALLSGLLNNVTNAGREENAARPVYDDMADRKLALLRFPARFVIDREREAADFLIIVSIGICANRETRAREDSEKSGTLERFSNKGAESHGLALSKRFGLAKREENPLCR
jgi:hypothetical protein